MQRPALESLETRRPRRLIIIKLNKTTKRRGRVKRTPTAMLLCPRDLMDQKDFKIGDNGVIPAPFTPGEADDRQKSAEYIFMVSPCFYLQIIRRSTKAVK